eukprot:Amastigsp_a844802_9.p6 type:complete len:116 gc:universal Amastigsp_a844802_9:472-125(-)
MSTCENARLACAAVTSASMSIGCRCTGPCLYTKVFVRWRWTSLSVPMDSTTARGFQKLSSAQSSSDVLWITRGAFDARVSLMTRAATSSSRVAFHSLASARASIASVFTSVGRER